MRTLQMEAQGELVLKQRDIMMALTKRLSDRDEQILILQEELDAYDAAQRRLEDALDQRTAEVLALRKAALEQVRFASVLRDASVLHAGRELLRLRARPMHTTRNQLHPVPITLTKPICS